MKLSEAVSKEIMDHLKSKGFSESDDVDGYPKISHRYSVELDANVASDITPLMRLCADNKEEGVRQLLAAKADLTYQIPDLTLTRNKMKKKVRLKDVTAHVLSAIYKKYKCLDLLYQAPYKDENEKGRHFSNAIWNATKYGRPKVIQYIFSTFRFGYSLYNYGKLDYIRKTYIETVDQAQLPRGFSSNVTALEHSIMTGNLFSIKILLSCGLNSDVAIRTRSDISVELSIRQKFADPNLTNRSGVTPLKLVLKYSKHNPKVKYEIVETLLQYKANVNDNGNDGSRYSDGCTPLHYAIENNDPQMITLLMDRGANLNIRNKKDQAPLQLAIQKYGAAIVNQFLLQAVNLNLEEWDLNMPGVNLNCTNERGQTPLHILIEIGSLNNARVLVVKGALINSQDKEGNTPLHLAVRANDLNFTRFLLTRGARLDLADKKGRTPLHIALNYLQPEMVSLLLHFMGFLSLEYIRNAFELAPPAPKFSFFKPKEPDLQTKTKLEKEKALSDLLIREFQYGFYLNAFSKSTLKTHLRTGLSDQDKSNSALMKFVEQNFDLTKVKRDINLSLFRSAYRIMKIAAIASPDKKKLDVNGVTIKLGTLNVGVVKIILSFVENSHIPANQAAIFTRISQRVIERAKAAFDKKMILHGYRMIEDLRKSDDLKSPFQDPKKVSKNKVVPLNISEPAPASSFETTGLLSQSKEKTKDRAEMIADQFKEDGLEISVEQLKGTGLTKRKGKARV